MLKASVHLEYITDIAIPMEVKRLVQIASPLHPTGRDHTRYLRIFLLRFLGSSSATYWRFLVVVVLLDVFRFFLVALRMKTAIKLISNKLASPGNVKLETGILYAYGG